MTDVGRKRTAAAAAAAVILLSLWALWEALIEPHDPGFCRGVGLLNTPVAATETLAAHAYIRQQGDDPRAWRKSDGSWVPRKKDEDTKHEVSFNVSRVPGGFAATAACV